MSIIETVSNAVDKLIHPKPSAEDLSKETVPQLKARAKEAAIKGFDGMKKAELIEALSGAPAIDQEKVAEIAQQMSEESSGANSDYANHPKFAKFKSSQGAE